MSIGRKNLWKIHSYLEFQWKITVTLFESIFSTQISRSLLQKCSLVAALCWLKKRRRNNLLSCFWLFGIPWTVAHQAPLSMWVPGARILVGHHFLLLGIFTQRLGVLAFQAVPLSSESPRKPRSQFWWGVWGGIEVCSNIKLSDQLLKETRKTTPSDMDFVLS